MSLADRRKWDAKYREGAYAERKHPTALLERFASRIPAGKALDVASGAGRNALFLARSGFTVDAVDISAVGLERLAAEAADHRLEVRTWAADLDDGLPSSLAGMARYNLIVMVRYVNERLLGTLADNLAADGLLVCEQHLVTRAQVAGPRSSAYRLEPNRLLDSLRHLRVHFYREGILADPDGRKAALAQAVASHPEVEIVVD